MRRWQAKNISQTCFVEFNGSAVTSIKKGIKSAIVAVGLAGKVTPHTLRHTSATWLMSRGVPIWEAAGFLGMSTEVLQNHDGHHRPDFARRGPSHYFEGNQGFCG
jgi:integrase